MKQEELQKGVSLRSGNPILTAKDNRLGAGREQMAKRLARSIAGSAHGEGMVVAICGRYGDGKTSVKNMLCESLEETFGETGPEVMPFAPWQLGGAEQTLAVFFDELSERIGRRKGEVNVQAAKHLKILGTTLSLGGLAAKFGGIFLTAKGDPSGLVVTAAAEAAAKSGEAVKLGSEAESAIADNHKLSAYEEKKEIAKLLKLLERPILVVVDDIDRLDADEIRKLFKLIKANADFPNIIYLLLFQRDIVELALTDQGIDGREFLKKIIPALYDLPPIDPETLQKLLFEELDGVWRSHGLAQTTNDGHWLNLWNGLQPLFVNLRDVDVFLNGYRFALDAFLGEHGLEVNAADLAALEAIRQFAPEVYLRIHCYGHYLAPLSPYFQRSKLETEKDFGDRLVSVAPERFKPVAGKLLGRLFPHIAHIFGLENLGDGFDAEWYKERRVCHPGMFSMYFAMSLGEDAVNPAQVEKLVRGSLSEADIAQELRELKDRGLLLECIQGLRAYTSELARTGANSERFVRLAVALADLADSVPDVESPSHQSSAAQVSGFILDYFNLTPVESRRGLFENLLTQIQGVVVPAQLAYWLGRSSKPALTKDVLEVIQSTTRNRILEASQDGRLAASVHQVNILYRWSNIGGELYARKYVDGLLTDRKKLFALLTDAVTWRNSSSSGDAFIKSEPLLKVSSLRGIMDVEKCNQTVVSFDLIDLTTEEIELRNLWVRGYNSRDNENDFLDEVL